MDSERKFRGKCALLFQNTNSTRILHKRDKALPMKTTTDVVQSFSGGETEVFSRHTCSVIKVINAQIDLRSPLRRSTHVRHTRSATLYYVAVRTYPRCRCFTAQGYPLIACPQRVVATSHNGKNILEGAGGCTPQ